MCVRTSLARAGGVGPAWLALLVCPGAKSPKNVVARTERTPWNAHPGTQTERTTERASLIKDPPAPLRGPEAVRSGLKD